MTAHESNKNPGTSLAIDLGATNLRVGLVTGNGTIRKVQREHLPKNLPDAEVITDLLIRMIHALADDNEICQFAGIGIGVAGPVDKKSGAIVHPPNIPLDYIPLSGPLQDEFGLPVRLVNDCCAGLLGEASFGEGKGCRNFVYVTMSTGIGAGIIANGHVISGRDGNAGEVGHFFVDSDYNLTCGCGGKGHWEGYASGRFLPRFYKEWQKKNGIVTKTQPVLSAKDIFSEIKKDQNPGEHEFIKKLGTINARGISSIIVAYDPDTIVLDGSVVLNNPDLILHPIEHYADRYLKMPRLVLSSLSGNAPLLGASIIANGYDTAFGSVE